MVLVDHAFIEPSANAGPGVQSENSNGILSAQQADTPPTLISATPIELGIEADRNFKKLPELNRRLHAWAISANPLRVTPEIAAECITAVSAATGERVAPLDTIPLIVVSTLNDSPKYLELQQRLLSLSRNSRQILAENSTHMVIVDEPDVVIGAIRQVVGAVRNHSALRR